MGRDARRTAKQTPASTSAAASWPSDVVFLDSLRYDAASVSPDVIEKYAPSARSAIKHTRANDRKRARGRIIDDATHPARGEFGLFANTRLRGRERVIDYHGVVTTERGLFQDDGLFARVRRRERIGHRRRKGRE